MFSGERLAPTQEFDAGYQNPEVLSPEPFFLLTGSSEKALALSNALKENHFYATATQIVPPGDCPEPDYINGEHLVKTKLNTQVNRCFEDAAAKSLLSDLTGNILNQDVNIAIGYTSGVWETVRKFKNPTGPLAENTAKEFTKFLDTSLLLVRVESASAITWWRNRSLKPKDIMVVAERAYLQLDHQVIKHLSDKKFVSDYLEFSRVRRLSLKSGGKVAGVTNENCPWGIRWDDLLLFCLDNRVKGLDAAISVAPPKNPITELGNLVNGFTKRMVKVLFDESAKRPVHHEPIVLYPPRAWTPIK